MPDQVISWVVQPLVALRNYLVFISEGLKEYEDYLQKLEQVGPLASSEHMVVENEVALEGQQHYVEDALEVDRCEDDPWEILWVLNWLYELKEVFEEDEEVNDRDDENTEQKAHLHFEARRLHPDLPGNGKLVKPVSLRSYF